MGAGASRGNAGVAANPRVIYNDSLAKKEQKSQLLDAPVLVDVQHGSIRYRYGNTDGEPNNKSRRTEKPYETEGDSTTSKQHYFYHARLKDFGQGADATKEDAFKFMYVTKGPARAQQKKLYYVYGRDLEAKDGTRVKPTETKEEGPDYSWPGLRVPNHLYYRLAFPQLVTAEASTEDPADDNVADVKPTSADMTFHLDITQTTRELRGKMAVSIQRAASDIHVCFGNSELKDVDVVGKFLPEGCQDQEEFTVELYRI